MLNQIRICVQELGTHRTYMWSECISGHQTQPVFLHHLNIIIHKQEQFAVCCLRCPVAQCRKVEILRFIYVLMRIIACQFINDIHIMCSIIRV